ncbi:MAG: glycosyltransferase involved in cell wall biosynthesis [Candidatus Azotimanducaceae bacterium]|jgi:glycosyltransferase involved in cell wall biosynthesis
MTLKIGVIIDPWYFPFNGTVVSTRRFVAALSDQAEFRLLVTASLEASTESLTSELSVSELSVSELSVSEPGIEPFPKLSIPGFNGIIDSMKVPLSNPWAREVDLDKALHGLDLVHVQFPFFLGHAVCRAANRLGLPLICSFHVQPENLLRNLGLESDWMVRWMYKLFIWGLYNRAELVLTPSQFAADQLRQHGLTKPVSVLSNGVPDEFFRLKRVRTDNDRWQLLSVGRLAPEKHQRTILDAVARSIFREQIDIHLIGTGPLQQDLEKQSQRLGLGATIGPVDDEALRRAYQTADLFVHGGEIELEGMSVLEAMAAGNAVLVSDSPGSAAVEFATLPNSLFRQGDVADLTKKIDYWLSNSPARTQSGLDNRKRAATWHHQQSVDQLLAIYEHHSLSRSA